MAQLVPGVVEVGFSFELDGGAQWPCENRQQRIG